MKEYVIVTDSTCDLPIELTEKYNIKVIPMQYHLDDKTYVNYLDYREQDVSEFYNLVKEGATPTTSQINPDDYIEYLKPILEEEKDVLIISFSSKLSGTFNSGRLAVNELKELYPNRNIKIIDSKSASLGEGMLVYLAALEKEKGLRIEQLEKYITKTIPTIAHWFTVDDIKHLERGGRISSLSSFVARTLNIKPIMHCDINGALIPRNKVISRRRAIKALFDKMVQTSIKDPKIVFIGHGDDLESALKLKEMIEEKYKLDKIVINTIGPVIGAHTGQGVLALFFEAENR